MNELGADPYPETPCICLTCGAGVQSTARCHYCASPRIFERRKAEGLSVAHLDCDAFYAAVEKRDRPELAEKPLIIGGGRRGVVATACYLARTRGVKSEMPMFKALRACPDAVVLKPDMPRYKVASRHIRLLMSEIADVVEPVSIDEAYLDFGDRADLADRAAGLARRIKAEVGVTVSIGLGPNKFVAKLASELEKPEGFSALSLDEARNHLADKPARALRGVGAAFSARLERDGFKDVAAIRRAGRDALTARYGALGAQIHDRAWALDPRAVAPPGRRKSVSAETTFSEDLADPDALQDVLSHIAHRTAERAENAGVTGRTVTLKLKRADHSTLTRSTTLHDDTREAERLIAALSPMLAAAMDQGPFRLLGVGVGNLAEAEGPIQAVLPFED